MSEHQQENDDGTTVESDSAAQPDPETHTNLEGDRGGVAGSGEQGEGVGGGGGPSRVI